jgi:hypothetical protein
VPNDTEAGLTDRAALLSKYRADKVDAPKNHPSHYLNLTQNGEPLIYISGSIVSAFVYLLNPGNVYALNRDIEEAVKIHLPELDTLQSRPFTIQLSFYIAAWQVLLSCQMVPEKPSDPKTASILLETFYRGLVYIDTTHDLRGKYVTYTVQGKQHSEPKIYTEQPFELIPFN